MAMRYYEARVEKFRCWLTKSWMYFVEQTIFSKEQESGAMCICGYAEVWRTLTRCTSSWSSLEEVMPYRSAGLLRMEWCRCDAKPTMKNYSMFLNGMEFRRHTSAFDNSWFIDSSEGCGFTHLQLL
ncbi:unnamed protein product [Lathyrus sativus]|nr:unnamed protein product [Lathyrus sativus]